MSKTNLVDFPLHLLEFLYKLRYLKEKEWRNLLNCTKYWQNFKRSMTVLVLNEKFSWKYYTSDKTREKIRQSVSNPGSQICLKYKYRPIIEDVTIFSNTAAVAFVNCFNLTNLSSLTNLHSLKLQHCDITDTKFLSNIRVLDLSGNSRLTDVSHLGRVFSLTLANCPSLKDVNQLGGNYYLDLSDCQRITNVISLGKVHTLLLRNLRKLVDVSALRDVKELDLSSCVKVRDVSMLGNIYALKLQDCKLSNISSLGNHYFLDISYCKKITDITSLQNVQKLSLRECRGIQTVQVLFAKHLDIYKCRDLDFDKIDLPQLKRLFKQKEKKLEYKFKDSFSLAPIF